MPDGMRFPALTFSHGILGTIQSLDDISQATRLGFKKGFFRDLVVVDSTCSQFRIVDARKVRTLPIRFRFGDFVELLSWNRRWQVELIFSANGPELISLVDVKRLIANCFEKEEKMWEEMIDFEEFRDKITAASSLEQIFAYFREFHVM